MNHEDKLRMRIGDEASDATTLYEYAVELSAKGRDKAAAKVHAKAQEHEAEAKFLRTRLSNWLG